MSNQDPVLEMAAVVDLRPTQMTVGVREVQEKLRAWKDRAERDGPEFLGRHLIPVLRGRKDRLYVVDHHHLGRALYDAGVKEVGVTTVADLSALAQDEFWSFCDNRGWCHPYDAHGERRPFADIPKTLAAMKDDPFRSLAGELRRRGGYAKEVMPFAEFLWADFLRRRLKASLIQEDFAAALTRALKLAHGDRAQHLPGWCGPVSSETA